MRTNVRMRISTPSPPFLSCEIVLIYDRQGEGTYSVVPASGTLSIGYGRSGYILYNSSYKYLDFFEHDPSGSRHNVLRLLDYRLLPIAGNTVDSGSGRLIWSPQVAPGGELIVHWEVNSFVTNY